MDHSYSSPRCKGPGAPCHQPAGAAEGREQVSDTLGAPSADVTVPPMSAFITMSPQLPQVPTGSQMILGPEQFVPVSWLLNHQPWVPGGCGPCRALGLLLGRVGHQHTLGFTSDDQPGDPEP